MFDSCYKILVGPIYNNHAMIGNYVHSPNVKVFMNEPTSEEAKYADLSYSLTHDSFADLLARLPGGWEPDLVVWWDLVFRGIPPGIEDCPYPTAAIIGDWNLGYTTVLQYLDAVDYILADKALIQLLTTLGHSNCHFRPNYSYDHTQHYLIPDTERVYDVTFIGNLNFRLHGKRSHYLNRLAQLGQQYNIFIAHGLFGEDYRRVLNQSKIVLNHSIRGEMNMRAYEAPACGALLFMEEDNLETSEILPDRQGCVFYNKDNFEDLIHYFIANEQERNKIVKHGHEIILKNSHQKHFEQLLELVPTILEASKKNLRKFKQLSSEERIILVSRQLYHAQSLNSTGAALQVLNQFFSPLSIPDISSRTLNAMGTLIFDSQFQQFKEGQSYPNHPSLMQALQLFKSSSQKHPDALVPNYHQALCLDFLGKKQEAKALYKRCLEKIESLTQVNLKPYEDFVLPYGYHHHFYIEWQRNRFQSELSKDQYIVNCRRLIQWQCCKQLLMISTLEKDLNQALSYAIQAFEQWPFGESAYLIAHLYRCLNLPQKAREFFEIALQKDTLLLDLWQEYSQSLWEMHEFEKLRKFCYTCLTILQHNQQAMDFCQQLKWMSAIAQIELMSEPIPNENLLKILSDYQILGFLKQNKALLEHSFLLELVTDSSVHWASKIAEPIPIVPGFYQVLEERTALLNIAQQRYDYAYFRSFGLAEGDLTPLDIPFQFPVNNILSEVVELEFEVNYLLLCPSLQMANLPQLLNQFGNSQKSDLHGFIYSLTPQSETDIDEFASGLSESAARANLTILDEPLSLTEMASLIHSVNLVVGSPHHSLIYYLWWSLFLGIPIWTLEPLPLVYKGFKKEDLDIFYRDMSIANSYNNLAHLVRQATIVQEQLLRFYNEECESIVFQTFWELKVKGLSTRPK